MVWELQGYLPAPARSASALRVTTQDPADTSYGYAQLSSISDEPFIEVYAHAGQSAPLLRMSDDSGNPVFAVGADGLPVINSPDGSRHRILVANDGTLSTELVT